MRRSGKLVALMLGIGLLTGCSEGGVTGLRDGSPATHSPQGAASDVDISGAWDWTNVEALRMPPFVASMVGITPEGRNTHARCESAGTMTLTQAGAVFQGTATRTFNSCETKGGQSFQQPGSFFVVADGRINGGSIHFSWSSLFVTPCPHHAVITQVQGGVAAALSGTGRCILPGHPQSESPVPLDPPPGGTSKTLSWEAVRP